jgi:hypothetical protein
MKNTIKIKFDVRSQDWHKFTGYTVKGDYILNGWEGVYYVRAASFGFCYVATKIQSSNNVIGILK